MVCCVILQLPLLRLVRSVKTQTWQYSKQYNWAHELVPTHESVACCPHLFVDTRSANLFTDQVRVRRYECTCQSAACGCLGTSVLQHCACRLQTVYDLGRNEQFRQHYPERIKSTSQGTQVHYTAVSATAQNDGSEHAKHRRERDDVQHSHGSFNVDKVVQYRVPTITILRQVAGKGVPSERVLPTKSTKIDQKSENSKTHDLDFFPSDFPRVSIGELVGAPASRINNGRKKIVSLAMYGHAQKNASTPQTTFPF